MKISFLKMEDAEDMGCTLFLDDRNNCTDCKHYIPNAWKGLCRAQIIQFPKVKNRCDTFADRLVKKDQLSEEAFWE